VEQIAAANIAINNAPIEDVGRPGTTAAEKEDALFGAANKNSENIEQQKTTAPGDNNHDPLSSLASELRIVVDAYVAELTEAQISAKSDKMGPPEAIRAVMGYISKLVEHTKKKGAIGLPSTPKNIKAMTNYRRFFAPGDICFTIPKDRVERRRPSPHYHAIEGDSIFIADWQLSHPTQQLCCIMCNKTLHHDRTNFSKNDNLFPIFEKSGRTMWGAIMRYDCEDCSLSYSANSGALLSSLPAHVRQAYPVDPRYAAGTYHLSIDITDDVDVIMKTYGNGNMISKSLYQQQGKHYTRKLENYFSINPNKNYVAFHDIIGSYAPSGAAIRFLYEQAENTKDTRTGVSNFERFQRELQSVQTDVAIAVDHTFAVVSNYNLPGAKAMFTMNTSTSEVAAMALVCNTKAEQISHLVEQMKRRRSNFDPKLIYTDTWPHNEEFWKMLLGFRVVGRLGLFHIMKRIMDTLNNRCHSYWKCVTELKACFYQYNKDDLEGLLRALKAGTLSSTGMPKLKR
jgi:hypothetical protein